ncbi:MAG TPA: hypothetical protein VGK11_06035, partial [Actinomycetota bacterium]
HIQTLLPNTTQIPSPDAVEDLPRGRHIPGLSEVKMPCCPFRAGALHVPTLTWAPLPRPDRAADEGQAAAWVGERVFV